MKRIFRIFDSFTITLLMSVLPTAWFSFFSVFAQESRLFSDEGGNLTVLSLIVNVVMIAVMLIFSIGLLLEKSLQKNDALKHEKMYTAIITGIDECNTVLQNKQVENLDAKDPGVMLSDYRSALRTILGNLLNCLTEITQIERGAFVATYFFRPRGQKNWGSISSDDGYKGVRQSDLLKNEASVVYQLLCNVGSVFYSSKEGALEKGKYIPDHRDEAEKNDFNAKMGSIFGANWSLSDFEGEMLFGSVITIATYGKEICTEGDGATKRALIENVLKVFKHQFTQAAFAYNIIKEGADE